MAEGAAAEEFAALLRELKDRSGLSYGVLAKRLHVSTSTLHRYCNGDAVPADYAPVERLARLCKASAGELVELHRRWVLADAGRGRKGAAGATSADTSAGAGTAVDTSKGAGTAAGAGEVGGEAAEAVSGGPGDAPRSPEPAPEPASGSEPDPAPWQNVPEPGAPEPNAPAPHPRPRGRNRVALVAGIAVAAVLGAVALAVGLPPGGGGGDGDDRSRTPVGAAAPEGVSRTPSPKPPPSASASAKKDRDARPSASPTPAPSAPASPSSGGADAPAAGARETAAPLTVSVRPYAWENPCSQHYLIDAPPTEVHPPPVEQGAPAWVADAGGVASGEQYVTLTVQGTGDETVILDGLKVRVVGRGAPLPWNDYAMGVGCGGDVPTRPFTVALDAARPVVVAGAGQRDFPFKVSESDPEVFHITADASAYDVRWVLELEWTSGARHGTVVLDDAGKPFRTSGDNGRPSYSFPLGGDKWIKEGELN